MPKLHVADLVDAGVPRKTILKIVKAAAPIKAARIEREQAIQNEMGRQREYVTCMLQRDLSSGERSMPTREPRVLGKASAITVTVNGTEKVVSADHFNPEPENSTVKVAHLTDEQIAKARGDYKRQHVAA